MGFIIKFYNNSSEKNKVDKTLTQTFQIEGTLKNESSVVNPNILIESSNMPTGNYARIDAFNRYYFITEITSVRNNLWQISMKCDVLSTYKSQIKKNSALISRQEEDFNLYLNDPEIKVLEDTFTITERLEGTALSFAPAGYVLIAQ